MELFLHIGPDKTGTTTIQKFLEENRETLAERGYLVPKCPGLKRHYKLYLYGFDDDKMVKEPSWKNRASSPEAFRREFLQQFTEEVRGSGLDRVVLSDEGLYRLSEEEIGRLQILFEGLFDRVHVVLYLRRQDDHVISRYQQVIKTGPSTQTFSEYLEGPHPYYFYGEIMERWAKRFNRENMRPRIFHRDRMVGGDLIEDFLACIGVEDREGFTPVQSQNVGLDAACTEFLRLYKIAYKERTGRDLHPLSQDMTLIVFLERNSTGGKLALPPARRERFMQRWEQSNVGVARSYFDRPEGDLFPPAKSVPEPVVIAAEPLSVARAVELFLLARQEELP